MKSFMLAWMLIIGCVWSAPLLSQDIAQERVIDLPEDGQMWATLLFTSSEWQSNAKEREIVEWFKTNKELSKLVAQTKFYHFTPRSLIYKHKFEPIVQGQFPCIIVQTFDGVKAYKVSGKNMPRKASALANAIAAKLRETSIQSVSPTINNVAYEPSKQSYAEDNCIRKILPLRPKPKPEPDVKPCPTPAPVVAVDTKPVLDDTKEQSVDKGPHWGVIVLLGLLGAGGAALVMFNKAVHA